MEIDIFEPRTMLAALKTMKAPQRHFIDTYAPGVRNFTTLSVDFDFYRDVRRMAPFSNPLSEGKVVDALGFKTKNFKPPYMKPKMRTTAQELMKRQMGQDLYAPTNPMVVAATKLGENLASLDDMISRREEWMMTRGLQDGKFTVSGDGDTRDLEFDYDSTHKVTNSGTDVWTDAASDPINDLLTWRRLVLKHYGKAPTDFYLGNGAAKAFINNTKVKALFNLWNINPGQIQPTVADNMIHYGYIQAIGMSGHVVNEWFIDPNDGVEKEFIDDARCLLLTRGARGTKYYGAIQLVDNLVSVARFPWSWVEKDPSVRWVQLHSASMPCIEEPDSVLTATVI